MIINKLKDISIYVNEKIDNKNLNCTNYIGVDNMLPNCAGITLSNYVPNTGKSTKFKKGDILIGNIRPYFKKIWLATFTGGCSPDVLVIRCNNTNDSKFVYTALANDNFFNYDMAGAKGSKMPRGDKSHIMNYEINFVHNYDRIGEILFNINNQIKRNNDMVQKLQDLATSTYSRWFNQFEFPNEDGLPYKSNGGKFIYNKELKRNIPIGWEAKDFLDLIEWKSSSQPPKSDFIEEYKEGYIRFIQNRDYENDNYKTYIPLTNNTKICTKYDIMIDKYGDAGKIRYGLEGAFNVALAKIEPLYENQQELIRKYLEQDCIYTYLNNACIASTRASLNELVFTGLKIIVPTKDILEKFEIMMKSNLNQVLTITNDTNKLNDLKSKLLPLLINGQLEV